MTSSAAPTASIAPIGIFDSGIGGLSVLRHIREQLPQESLLYFADSAHNPYGDKNDEWIIQRSLSIAGFLFRQGAKALVVACNTATAAAIQTLRAQCPDQIIIGLEPGLKPATLQTQSGHIGVLATQSTLRSKKFLTLCEQLKQPHLHVHLQACAGLADQIEKGELSAPDTADMLKRYLAPLMESACDCIVLGCTHYPFVRPLIEEILNSAGCGHVQLIDTGDAVARHLKNSLIARACLNAGSQRADCRFYTSGSPEQLSLALSHLLQMEVQADRILRTTETDVGQF